jgi:NADPH-dependent 2,4-dienoyl-CoA reductase/sulfur reductase-like enzyme
MKSSIDNQFHTNKFRNMAPGADHEGYSFGEPVNATTVVVVGAGPSGLMLA